MSRLQVKSKIKKSQTTYRESNDLEQLGAILIALANRKTGPAIIMNTTRDALIEAGVDPIADYLSAFSVETNGEYSFDELNLAYSRFVDHYQPSQFPYFKLCTESKFIFATVILRTNELLRTKLRNLLGITSITFSGFRTLQQSKTTPANQRQDHANECNIILNTWDLVEHASLCALRVPMRVHVLQDLKECPTVGIRKIESCVLLLKDGETIKLGPKRLHSLSLGQILPSYDPADPTTQYWQYEEYISARIKLGLFAV